MRGKRYNKLEVVLRITGPDNNKLSEYIIREDGRVEVINYYWNGEIEQHARMTLDQFVELLHKEGERRAV